jgi:hypothetical protein
MMARVDSVDRNQRTTITTAGPPNRPRRERAFIRSGTKPTDDDWSNHATGGRADELGELADTEHAGATIETDGGVVGRDEDGTALRTYTDDEFGYSLAYPADWSVEPDLNGGTTFEAPRSAAGAAVFIEENRLTPEAAAAAFLDDLAADEHVHARELLAQQDVRLESGQTGRVVECTYADDSRKRWRLSYLFVRADGTGYTLGIDWNDTSEFDATATAMVESFTLGAS